MKPQLKNLRIGEKVWALIEEVIEGNELMVNFSGDLLRISNESNRKFRPGQRVLLAVENTQPLKFKLITPNSRSLRGRPSLDISI